MKPFIYFLLCIFMNMLGILILFISKYRKRKVQESKWSPKYWVTRNWERLSMTLLVNIGIEILVLTKDITVNPSSFLPGWVNGIGLATISFLLGLGLSEVFYRAFSKKKAKMDGSDI